MGMEAEEKREAAPKPAPPRTPAWVRFVDEVLDGRENIGGVVEHGGEDKNGTD